MKYLFLAIALLFVATNAFTHRRLSEEPAWVADCPHKCSSPADPGLCGTKEECDAKEPAEEPAWVADCPFKCASPTDPGLCGTED